MALGLCCFASAGLAKPNVVLIYIDDYGWRDVGFNGTKFYETPNADRIAREGMNRQWPRYQNPRSLRKCPELCPQPGLA